MATCHILEAIFICSSNEVTSQWADSNQSAVIVQDPSVFCRGHTGELNSYDRGQYPCIPEIWGWRLRVVLISFVSPKMGYCFLFAIFSGG